MKKKKVAILGCGESEAAQQLDGNEFEFWGVNNGYWRNEGLPWTRWFEIHRIKEVNGVYFRRDTDKMGGLTVRHHLDNLNELDIPIYMHKKWKIVKKSKPFPLMDVLERFPRGHFNNTIAWEIGLAILEGFKEIHVYEIASPLDDFGENYIHRLSTEYMLGIAEGLGIKVHVPHYSDLLKSKYLYGFQENPGTYQTYINALAEERVPTIRMKKFLGIDHT